MKRIINATVLLIVAILLVCYPAMGQAQTRTIQKKRTSHAISVAYPLSKIQVTSPYGTRSDPFTKKKSRHNGLDLKAHYEPAYAMFHGKVIRTGYNPRAGHYVTLRHGSLTISYCHLSRILVKQGRDVRPGTVIGVTGNSGRSTGPHLHLTLKKDGKAIDPSVLLAVVAKMNEYFCKEGNKL